MANCRLSAQSQASIPTRVDNGAGLLAALAPLPSSSASDDFRDCEALP